MRRDDRHPFDLEADEAADITQQFWGTTRGWAATDDAGSDVDWSDRTPRSIQGLRSSLRGARPRRPRQPTRRSDVTGRIDRTRVHGARRHEPVDDLDLTRREATLAELAAGWVDDDDWPELDFPTTRLPPQPRRRVEPVSRAQAPVAPDRPRPIDLYPEDLDEVDGDSGGDPDHLVPLSPVAPLAERLGLGAVDPLLARLGAIVVVAVLAIPLALSARGGAPDDVLAESVAVPAAQATASVAAPNAGVAPAAAQAPVVATAASQTDEVTQSPAPAAEATVESSASAQEPAAAIADADAAPGTTPSNVAAVPQSAAPTSVAVPAVPEAATVTEPADRDEPVCALTYEAGAGDSWYRIADAAGVSPRALMAANGANLDTTIFPGDEICLPEGASMPSKPAPSTTAAPAATQPPTTNAPTTTAKPTTTTTVKPASTTSPPPAPVSTSAVQDLIREIWPDELEDKALQIAYRESNYRSNAYNGTCCYGVFQIHWTSHKSWLDDHGITSTNDLFDARKNITAAYALYQRSGGWGPWGG
jgi:hypothetical protein